VPFRASLIGVPLALALLAAGPAWAQDAETPAPDTSPSSADSATATEDEGPRAEPGMTIWVFEDGEVKRTREEVGLALRDLGYRRRKTQNGRDVYSNADPWKPWVYVDDDGWMMMRRAPVTFGKPEGLPGIWRGPLGYLVCVVTPTACIRIGGQVVSRKKLRPSKVEVLETIGPAMRRYENAVVERAMKERVDVVVPQALDALWNDGVPLSGDGKIDGFEARRAAVLDFWLGRADDGYGDRVREVVELWCRNTVQSSDQPFTPAEIGDAKARRTCTRPIEGLFYVVTPVTGATR
jgi:hypothetical protein